MKPAQTCTVDTSSRRTRKSLRQRTADALRSEITFIPAPQFQTMDLAEAVGRAEQETASSHAKVELARRGDAGYMTRLCAEPLLDAKTERELFCLMNYLKFRANSIRSGLSESKPSRSKLDKIEQFIALALQLRNRIVKANVRLVVSLVKRYSTAPNIFEDLMSQGISCLMNTAEKFDFSRGYRFSTYATRAITRDAFQYSQRRHRDSTRFMSGSAPLVFEGVEQRPAHRDEATWLHLDSSISKMMQHLDDRERFIVRMRFGFDQIAGKPTFKEIGKLLGVSKERVRQLESRAISKLRHAADDYQLEEMM